MADKKDIKEGTKFKTASGRIGKAYAVTQKKIDEGLVDLFFEGSGGMVIGIDFAPPSQVCKIKSLTMIV